MPCDLCPNLERPVLLFNYSLLTYRIFLKKWDSVSQHHNLAGLVLSKYIEVSLDSNSSLLRIVSLSSVKYISDFILGFGKLNVGVQVLCIIMLWKLIDASLELS